MTSSLFQLANAADNYSVVLDPLVLLVQDQLKAWFSQGDYLTQTASVFSATAGSEVWNVNAQNLQQSVLNGTYSIRLEVRSGSELGGAFGAYSATGTTGTPTIYLNGDWLSAASAGAIQAVLLEELGHSFDQYLNNGADSQGDEGELFADRVRGVTLSADQLSRIQSENDSKVITLDGQSVAIEQAAFIPPPSDPSWSAVSLKRASDPNKGRPTDGVWTAAASDLVGNNLTGADARPYLMTQTNGSSIAFKFRAEAQSGEYKALVGIFVDIDNDGSPDLTIGISINNNSANGYQIDELYFIPIFTNSLTPDSNTRPNNTEIPKLSDNVYFNFKTNKDGNTTTSIDRSKYNDASGVDNLKVYTNTYSTADGLISGSVNPPSATPVDVDADGNPENEYVLSFTFAQMDDFRSFINTVNGAGSTYKAIPSWNANTKFKAAGLTASNSLNAINGDVGGGGFTNETPWKEIFGEDEPPVAVNDIVTVFEGNTGDTVDSLTATGNLLTNDSDPDADIDRVTKFTIAGTTYTITSGGSKIVYLYANGSVNETGTGSPYGSLTIASNGSYTFTRTNPDYAGPVPLVTYTVADKTAKTATANLSISITPVNDAPVTADTTVTIDEDNSYKFTLNDFAFSDGLTDVTGDSVVDGIDGLANNATTANSFQSVIITSLPTAGTLRLNGVAVTAGQVIPTSLIPFLTFTPAPNAFDANSYATFTFQVRDNGGTANSGQDTSAPKTVTIKVNPVNDAPVAVSDSAIAVEVGSAPVGNGGNAGTNPFGNVLTDPSTGDSNPDGRTNFISSVSFNGNSQAVALNTTSTLNPTTVTGTYGSLKIGSNGSYIYEVNNSNATVDALRTSANTLTETFTYTLQDSSGLSSTTTLTVTIRGSNDNPVANPDTNIVKSPAPGVASGDPVTGNVLTNDTDVDSIVNGETKQLSTLTTNTTGTASITNITVTAGSVTPIPIVVNTVVNSGNNPNGIQIGDLLFLNAFTGGTAINTGISVSNVVDNGGGSFTVTLNASKSTVDRLFTSNQDLFFRAQNGNSGNPSGGTNTSDSQAKIQLTTNRISVTSTSNLYVGMVATGTNIPAGTIITAIDSATNTVTVSKPIATAFTNQALTFSLPINQTLQGQYGTLQLNADGSYSYTPTVNVVLGDTAVERFTYQMQDTAGAKSISTLTITIEGTASGGPDAKPDIATITENTASYDGSNNYITNPGGNTAQGNIITGANTSNSSNQSDSPNVSTSLTGVRVWRLGTTEPSSTSNLTSTNSVIEGLYGNLTINSTGAYTYALKTDPATVALIDSLNQGSNLVDVFNYRIINANGSDVTTLTVTINGVNDPPKVQNDTGTAREVGGTEPGFNATGNVLTNDSDVDNAQASLTVTQIGSTSVNQTATAETAITGTYGTLYIKADGTYRYEVNNSNGTVNALPQGSNLTETFTYTVSDNQAGGAKTATANLVITVQGANDAPVNTVPSPFSNIPQGQYTNLTGFSASDVDRDSNTLNASELQTVTLSVNNGTLRINPNFAIPNTVTITGLDTGVLTITATGTATADHQLAIQNVLAQLQYQSNSFFSGTDKLTITSSDGLGLSATNTVDIGVTAPALTTSPVAVNEGSSYAVFTVDGAVNQGVLLSLAAGTATVDVDYSSNLQYWNGSNWVSYTAGVPVVIPNNTPNNTTSGSNGSGLLYVRVALTNDSAYESASGGETFTLRATNSAGSFVDSTATIKDDGTGITFNNNGVSDGTADNSVTKDDDRPLTISSPTVTEGVDPYAVFTVTGKQNQWVKLALQDNTAQVATDYGYPAGDNIPSNMEYSTDGGSTWQPYTVNAFVQITRSDGTIQVRTKITNDTLVEASETLKLSASNTGGSSYQGTATINDDELSVANVTVNEGSQWAVFNVSGLANSSVTLALANVTTGLTISTDTIQYFNGSSWVDYTSGSNVSINLGASGNIDVRVKINSESDPQFEGAQTFNLVASNGSSSSTGTGTIVDNGTGLIYNFASNTSKVFNVIDAGPSLDDDRPLTVAPVYPSGKTSFQEVIDLHANFTVTTNGNTDQQYVKLAVANITATGGLAGDPNSDYGTQIQYWGFNGSQWTWLNYTPGSYVQVPPADTVNPYSGTALNGTVLPVRVDVFNNSPTSPADASSETFKLIATNTGNSNYEGTATITEAPTGNLPPRLDLDLTTPLNPDDLSDGSADYAKNFIENGQPVEFTRENSPTTVDSITDPAGPDVIEFLKVSILNQDLFDGSNEKLLIVDGTTTITTIATITLDFGTNNSLATFTLGGVNYKVASVDNGTGGSRILTFTKDSGNLTRAQAETLLEALRYRNTSEDPTGGTGKEREFTVTVKDDLAESNPADFVATVIPVNDEPTLAATSSNPTYTENASAVSLFSGSSVSTIEANQTLIQLTLTVSGLKDGSNEKLTINGTEISLVDGTNIPTTNGTITVTVINGTASLVFTPTTGLSTTDTQSLINSLAYRHTSENPTGGDRVITLTSLQDSGGTANNGDDTGNFTLASTVTVNPVNDPPVLDLDATAGGGSTLNNTVTFTEMVGTDTGANAVNFAKGIDLTNGNQSGTNISDVDSPTLSNFKVSIAKTQIATGDQLRFGSVTIDLNSTNVTTDPNTTSVKGEVTYTTTSGTTVFRYTLTDDGSGNRILTFTSLSGSNGSANPASLASYEALVDDLKYNNISNTPSGSRVFSNTVTDSSGATSTPATFTVNIQPSNDPPVAAPDTATVNEDTNLVINASSGLLANDTDPENNTLTVTQFTIGGNTYNAGETASINGVGSLTILADGGYAFLPALNFNGSVPQATYTISDGNGSTASSTLNITVNPVNDQPRFNNSLDNTPTYTINSSPSPIALDGSVTVTDPELSALNSGNGNWNGATLTLARDGGASSRDVFTYDGVAFGSTVSVEGTEIANVTTNSQGTLVLTFTANATTDLVQKAIQKITYGYTPDSTTPPSSVKINYTLNDGNTGSQGSGGALTDSGSITVNLTDNRPIVIDTPVINEGSPFAVFTVDGAVGQQVKLSIAGGTATAGTDFSSSLEYWDGTAWKPYTANSTITIPASNDGVANSNTDGYLYVRNAITNDPGYESGSSTETFTLTATNAANTPSTGGTASIKDNGTGTIYTGVITSGSPVTDTTSLKDDDRPLTVTGNSVTEGAGVYSQFTIARNYTGDTTPQLVKLNSLGGGTATGGSDYNNNLANAEYSINNGVSWIFYSPSSNNGYITIPNGENSILVRVSVIDDSAPESLETFNLTVQNTGGSTYSGAATINDIDTNPPTLDLDPSTVLSGTFPNFGTTDDNSVVFTENGAAVAFTKTGTSIADLDGDAISALTLSFANGTSSSVNRIRDGAAEQLLINGGTQGSSPANIALNFGNGASITNIVLGGLTYQVIANVNGTTNTSTLTFSKSGGGNLTKAQAETLLDALRYQVTGENPTDGDRVFNLKVNDGTADSNTATLTVNVNPVNDPPVINQLDGDYLSYRNALGAVLIDQLSPTGQASISDLDVLRSGGYLTVSFYATAGLIPGSSDLGFKSGSPVTTDSNKNVLVNGTVIGTLDTVSNGEPGKDLKIIFNANIDNALATTLIQNITYQYTGSEQGVTSLIFSVSDGGDGTNPALFSNPAIVDITVNALSGFTSLYPGGTDTANTIYGNSTSNVNEIIHGRGSNDRLYGYGGDDLLFGDGGSDILYGGNNNDNLFGGTDNDTLYGEADQDALYGEAGNDTLYGGTGNDTLDGGAGSDYMQGDQGDDTYIVDAVGDSVYEVLDSGNDMVLASVTYTLPSNVEGLVLTGTGAINVTGNGMGNILTGNAAKNRLTGGLGNDLFDYRLLTNSLVANYDSITDFRNTSTEQDKILVSTAIAELSTGLTVTGLTETGIGHALTTTDFGANYAAVFTLNGTTQTFLALNDDRVGYQENTDAIIEITGYNGLPDTSSFSRIMSGSNLSNYASPGMSDSLNGTTGNDTLLGYDGHDTLFGSDGNDSLDGGNGNDSLNGGAGNDTLIGGAGNNTLVGGLGDDRYVLSSTTDVVTELASSGTDTLEASFTYSLATLTHLENLTLTGTASNGTGNTLANIITGNTDNNSLDGGAGNDTLLGGAGNDTLIGGAGVDRMEGGLNDDVYFVDVAGDLSVENANAGMDIVHSTVTYTLAANVENLLILGTTNLNGTGNTLANILTGNSGNNSLVGSDGNDTLLGGEGNDTLVGGTGTNSLVGGLGNDVYVVDSATDAIIESLNEGLDAVRATVSHTLANNVENLTLLGSTAINGTGNILANVITGNTGNNRLEGVDGNDTLDGSSGLDTLIGGSGNDLLTGGVGADVLTGSADVDRFDYRTLSHSVLGSATVPGYDRITDFEAGTDRMVTTTARTGFINAGSINTTAYTSLTSAAIASVLTTSNFTANGAALFTYGTRSLIALNDATAGYGASDGLVEVTGYTGSFSFSPDPLALNAFTTSLI